MGRRAALRGACGCSAAGRRRATARVREPHHEHRQLGQLPVQEDAHLPEVGLRLLAGRMQLGNGHLGAPRLELATQAPDVGAPRRLGDTRAALVDEALPDPPRGVALLTRRAQVGHQPRADRLAVRTELRRRTVRRCTRCRRARPRIDTRSSRRSRRICSNSSTLDNSSSFARGSHVHPSVVRARRNRHVALSHPMSRRAALRDADVSDATRPAPGRGHLTSTQRHASHSSRLNPVSSQARNTISAATRASSTATWCWNVIPSRAAITASDHPPTP